MAERKAYPADLKNEEWGFVAPWLIFFLLHADSRRHDLRQAFNVVGAICMVGAGD